MKKKQNKQNNDYIFAPIFRPSHVQVLLDEGMEEMRGGLIQLQIKKIEYEADYMRIYVNDYRGKE